MRLIVCAFSVLILCVAINGLSACKGCVNLDEFSFRKVLPRFEAVLVKFDAAYPYGDKHETFTKFADEIADVDGILVGEVGIKDYGERDNEEFAKQHGVASKEDLPHIKLFLKNPADSVDFPRNSHFTVDNLRNLIRDNTNIYIGLPGCLEKYDKIAMNFIKIDDKQKELAEAENLSEIAPEEEKTTIKTYLLFMKKIIEQGTQFILQEKTRLGKIINEGKLNMRKKQELTQRLNILHSFSTIKEEL